MRFTTTLGLLIGFGLTSACSIRSSATRQTHYASPPGATIPQGNSVGAAASCAQVEVAPGVFRSTDCERRPAMRTSAFVRRFQLPLLQTSRGLVPISKAELPARVDLRERGLDGPVRDQGQVGVCWSMAMSGVADNALRRAGQTENAAPLHLIANRAYERLYQSGQSEGFTREPLWSYDPGRACKLRTMEPTTAARSSASLRAPGVTIRSWCEEALRQHPSYLRLVDAESLSNTDEIATALAQGRAAYLDLYIDRNVWSCRGMSGGKIPDYTSTTSPHAVTVVGYQVAASVRQFLIKNSWGKQWGEGGYGWIDERSLQRNFRDAFVFDVRDAKGVPFPHGSTANEPQQPTPPNTCKAGQARDLVFGICMPACAGGKPSLGGLCVPQAPTASSASCGAGQARDPLSGQCVQPCPSGLLPVGGVCWLG
ncbi:MAG: C1 family peptidase [Polyangiaceae bacterium]